MDCWGALTGGGGIAYLAHLGGFLSGAGAGWLLIVRFGLRSDRHEENLLEILRLGPYRPEYGTQTTADRRGAALAASTASQGGRVMPETDARTRTTEDFAVRLIAEQAQRLGVADAPAPRTRVVEEVLPLEADLHSPDDDTDEQPAEPTVPEVAIAPEDFRPPDSQPGSPSSVR